MRQEWKAALQRVHHRGLAMSKDSNQTTSLSFVETEIEDKDFGSLVNIG